MYPVAVYCGARARKAKERGRELAGAMSSSDLDISGEVAEPFRFNFEIAWEVANKGQSAVHTQLLCTIQYIYT